MEHHGPLKYLELRCGVTTCTDLHLAQTPSPSVVAKAFIQTGPTPMQVSTYCTRATTTICTKQCFIIRQSHFLQLRTMYNFDALWKACLRDTMNGCFTCHDARHTECETHFAADPCALHRCSTSAMMVLSVIARSTCLALGLFFFFMTCMHARLSR